MRVIMAKRAQSISANKLAEVTREAVKAVNAQGRFIGRGPILGFVPPPRLDARQKLALAGRVTNAVAQTARAQGVSGLRAKPVVVIRPGTIIAGFIAAELPLSVR
jgi:hypothetical protein